MMWHEADELSDPPALPPASDYTWGADQFAYTAPMLLTGGKNPIDLTGRGRYLLHGPYQLLPAGRWVATMRFEFDSNNIVEAPLEFQWGYDGNFVNQTFDLLRTGLYDVTLTNTWLDEAYAQFRIRLLRPVFHGSVRIIACSANQPIVKSQSG